LPKLRNKQYLSIPTHVNSLLNYVQNEKLPAKKQKGGQIREQEKPSLDLFPNALKYTYYWFSFLTIFQGISG